MGALPRPSAGTEPEPEGGWGCCWAPESGSFVGTTTPVIGAPTSVLRMRNTGKGPAGPGRPSLALGCETRRGLR